MPHYRIALLPGDGIGPEVVASALDILQAVASRYDSLTLSYDTLSVGAGEYLKSGDPLPPATVEAIRGYDATLLGAMGLPDVRWPNGVEMTPQIDLREQLCLYQGVRPIKLYHPCHSPLREEVSSGIDLLLMRENTEGLFFARREARAEATTVETDTMRISREGSLRICHAAFAYARKRRKQVTLVDKANVLLSMAFFRRIFDEVAAAYPDVETDRVYVDAMALYLVQSPSRFDVIVTENMFGDILSDLTAGIVGGMGMAPSADIGDEHAVFQPSHGSAPTIAGQGIANPVATVLSAALMLEWLGDADSRHGAARIEAAVARVLADPANRTQDLGGTMTTADMTQAILDALA